MLHKKKIQKIVKIKFRMWIDRKVKITINQDDFQLWNNELFFALKSLIIRILDIYTTKPLE